MKNSNKTVAALLDLLARQGLEKENDKKLDAASNVASNVAPTAAALDVVTPDVEAPITGIAFDSRYVEAGMVFFAIRGLEADGRNYLKQVAAKGALLAVIDAPLSTEQAQDLKLPLLKVPNCRKALAEAAAWFYDHPSNNLELVGITASNGKTSTSLMYRQIVLASGAKCGLIGTVSYETAKRQEMSHLTTPDACKLQALLAEMRDTGYQHAVMECSSIGLDQARNYATKYRAVAFNNLSREHLDYHGSLANYLAAKSRLISEIADSETAVILNCDDPLVYAEHAKAPGLVIGFGDAKKWEQQEERENTAAQPFLPTILADNIDLSKGQASFDFVIKANCPLVQSKRNPSLQAGCQHVQLKVAGYHSVMNALSAMSLALAMGFDLNTVLKGISSYTGIERRFQLVFGKELLAEQPELAQKCHFKIFDDHFANPGNIAFSLESLCQMDYQRLVLVYALRGKRGAIVNRENIEKLAKYLPKLRLRKFIATCSKDVVGHYDEVQPEELAGFKGAMAELKLDYTLLASLTEAVTLALDEVQAGDVILLAGCQGMDAGARLALEELSKRLPNWPAAVIMASVKDRICGQADEASNKDKLFAGGTA